MHTNRLLTLFRELKRRKVFRVAAVYAGVSFILAQVADIAFPALHLPPWTLTLVVVLIILGFPVALILAWAFDITPEGVVRTESLGSGEIPDGAESVQPPSVFWTLPRAGTVAGAGVLIVIGGFWALLGGKGFMAGVSAPSNGSPSMAALISASGAVVLPPSDDLPALERSIAVLPLLDLSPGGDHEWFSDGLTDDILIHLAHLGDLKVIGRTSVMRYKGREVGARQIGQELDVATILEGSVRRAGDRVRISVQLIHAATDQQIWAESFDRDLTDIFEIQSEIARRIAGTLDARLSRTVDLRMARAPTGSFEAYDHYLRGREHTRRLTRPDLLQAMESFRQALILDPGFAQAHAGLAGAYAAMHGYHHDGPHWVDSAFVAARKAIALDPEGADGISVLALAQWNSGRLGEAVETYGRALALRPNDAEAYWGLAFTRWLQSELPEALRTAGRSVDLDPGHPGHAVMLGRVFGSLGDVDRAEEWFRYAMELQPDFPWAHQDFLWVLIRNGAYETAEAHLDTIRGVPALAREYHQGLIHLAMHRGDYQAAADRYEEAREWLAGGVLMPAEVGFIFARLGDEHRAREILQGVLGAEERRARLRPDDHVPQSDMASLARAAAAAGDPERAMAWLQGAYEAGWRGYPSVDIARDPVLQDLLDDLRFQRIRTAILEDVGRMRRLAEAEGRVSSSLSGPGT